MGQSFSLSCLLKLLLVHRRDHPRRGVSTKPSLTGAVTVDAHHCLGSAVHLLFLHPAAGMEIVDAGEHIFQSECVMKNAVCGIPERQRQLRCCKLFEEREHQSCQCTFPGSGLTYQKQNELGFASGGFEEVVEGTEEGKGQQRKYDLLRRDILPEQAGGSLDMGAIL